MSSAVVHGNTVYLAGLTADDTKADVKGQTKQILDKIDKFLTEAGTDKSKILSANIWLTDIGTWGQMNEVWDAWFARQHAGPRHRRGQARQSRAQGRDHGAGGAELSPLLKEKGRHRRPFFVFSWRGSEARVDRPDNHEPLPGRARSSRLARHVPRSMFALNSGQRRSRRRLGTGHCRRLAAPRSARRSSRRRRPQCRHARGRRAGNRPRRRLRIEWQAGQAGTPALRRGQLRRRAAASRVSSSFPTDWAH